MAKLLCNNCYQPLETVEYPEGIYVNPCGCHIEQLDREWREMLEEAEHEAYKEGQWTADEDARENYEPQIEALEREIADLKEKLEEYNSDDEYNERIGA